LTDSAAEQAAPAINSDVARLRLLETASRTIAEAGLDISCVLQAIVASTTEHLADSATITLISEDGEFFDVAATHDRDPAACNLLKTIQVTTPRLRINEGIVGAVAREGRPMLVPHVDPERVLDSVSAAYRPYATQYRLKSMLVVPVRVRARVIGTFALVRRSGEAFTAADLDLASDIAGRAGLAMENARLYARAEEARAQAEVALARAEAAVRGRDNALAIVSHDLRAPLSVIMMAATRIVADAAHGTKRHGEMIVRASDRMRRLIGDLLDVAQLEAGAFTVDPRPHDVRAFLTHAAEILAPVLVQRSQSLAVSACDTRIRIDRERLLQVIVNLGGNASKFSPPGSTICLDAAVRGDEVEICVTDEGPGIPPDALGTVFDRFAQSTASGRARRLGVGLGLTIARGIVEAHGGRISAENVPARGARLRIVLPRVVAAATPTASDVAEFFAIPVEQVNQMLDGVANDVGWKPGPVEGVTMLSVTPGRAFEGSLGFLVHIVEGVTYPSHEHDADETLLMLRGGLRDDDGTELWAGDSVRNVKGTTHASTALDGGCLLAARVGAERH
jgi:signal transduction histidine kinase